MEIVFRDLRATPKEQLSSTIDNIVRHWFAWKFNFADDRRYSQRFLGGKIGELCCPTTIIIRRTKLLEREDVSQPSGTRRNNVKLKHNFTRNSIPAGWEFAFFSDIAPLLAMIPDDDDSILILRERVPASEGKMRKGEMRIDGARDAFSVHFGAETFRNINRIRYANFDLASSSQLREIRNSSGRPKSRGSPGNWIKLLKGRTFVRNYLIPVETSFSVSTSTDLHISRITITPYPPRNKWRHVQRRIT